MSIENRPPSKLDGIGWSADAELYRVLLRVGITPPIADEMELWQLGAVLGAHDDRTEGIAPELWERERDSLKDRADAIRQTTKERVEETDITDMVMSQMGIKPG